MGRSALVLLVTAALCAGVQPAAGQTARRVDLAAITAGLDSLAGDVVVYFRPWDRARAHELSALLGDFARFYREQADVDAMLRVAVLDEADWSRLARLPYGAPNNTGPDGTNLLFAASSPPARIGVRPMPPGRLGDLLVLGHEGGHLLIWEMMPDSMKRQLRRPEGPSPAVRERLMRVGRTPGWYWELAANYLATAFIATEYPADSAAWLDYLRATASGAPPRYTHLDDWYGRLMGDGGADASAYRFTPEGSLNQAWFQGVTGLVAAHVHRTGGLGYLEQLRANLRGESTPTTVELIEQLEAQAPGTMAMLADLGVGWR